MGFIEDMLKGNLATDLASGLDHALPPCGPGAVPESPL
jgi:hypothetical protein